MTTNISSSPAISFGVLSDVQYADKPNRLNFLKTSMRYYRNSLKLVHEAALTWNEEPPSFVIHLGDLIDGFNSREGGKANSEKALGNILAEFDKFNGPVHHVLGNHDFYNFSRKELWDSRLNTTQLAGKVNGENDSLSSDPTVPLDSCGCSHKLYYKFSPHPQFCFVVLDTYDIGGCSHVKECPRHEEGLKILCAVNKNTGFELNSPTGLEGRERRFVLFNGAVSQDQLQWLRNVLEEATRKQQTVFIFGHIPIFPDVTPDLCLLWNYDEVLETIGQYDCVAAVLSGHTHSFRYGEDANGIHHIVFPGIVEVLPGSNAFATIDAYTDHCDIKGYGDISSFSLKYPACKKIEKGQCADDSPTETPVDASTSNEVLVKS